MPTLVEFLRKKRSEIVKKVRTNIVRKRVGYSERTQWDTTVSFDEIEVFDFDELLNAIDEFEQRFKKPGVTDAVAVSKDDDR